MINNEKLITIKQAANFLATSESRIRYEIFHKRIPYIKFGKSIRFDEKDLLAWVLSQKQGIKNEK